ncbi:uncharacterized protein METZ01_LOCUS430691, partial [marine metagenome]
MNPTPQERFGNAAAHQLSKALKPDPPVGQSADSTGLELSLPDTDRVLGALMGIAIGEAIGAPVEGRTKEWIEQRIGRIEGFLTSNPRTGSDTALALLTFNSVIDDPANHPQLLAARLSQSHIASRGQTLDYTRNQL